jgi:hypothetical protein
MRGGLTQALGVKEHSAVALSALQVDSFVLHCSSGTLPARFFFGLVRLARSHDVCVTLAGFVNNARHLPVRHT